MPRIWEGTTEQWSAIRKLWREGASNQAIVEKLALPVTPPVLGRKMTTRGMSPNRKRAHDGQTTLAGAFRYGRRDTLAAE